MHISRTPFPKNTSGWLLLHNVNNICRCSFYVWQKRDFFDIFCKTIYEDDITWTIPSLNFSFVDKRLKIPNLFVQTREHYCMLNYDSSKLGAFKDKVIPIGKCRENSVGDNFFSIKTLSKKFGTWKHSCISYLKT